MVAQLEPEGQRDILQKILVPLPMTKDACHGNFVAALNLQSTVSEHRHARHHAFNIPDVPFKKKTQERASLSQGQREVQKMTLVTDISQRGSKGSCGCDFYFCPNQAKDLTEKALRCVG